MADIRMANKGDAAAVAAIYSPYVTDAVTSFEIDPPGPGDMAARIEDYAIIGDCRTFWRNTARL